MKPLELCAIERLWEPLLRDLAAELALIGEEPQVWYPAGDLWLGRDRRGRLPATALPSDLGQAGRRSFAGRIWQALPVVGAPWLISLHGPAQGEQSWPLPPTLGERLDTMSRLLRLEGLLTLFVTTLETVAREDSGHWNRVRHFAVHLGQQLGLDEEALFELEVAALVHDVGKAMLPPELLAQQGPLDEGQRRQMENHPLLGAGLIRGVPGLGHVAELVATHHEAPDGSGYPRGLAGTQIPLPALIIAATDAFDAMTHHRPYARPQTYREAVAAMAAQAGKYSPQILTALSGMLQGWGMLDTPTHPGPAGPTTPPPLAGEGF